MRPAIELGRRLTGVRAAAVPVPGLRARVAPSAPTCGRPSQRHRTGEAAGSPSARSVPAPARAASSLAQQIAVAGITTGGLNLASDVLTQSITRKGDDAFDPARTLRMVSHGLFFYGPLQLFWYRWLEQMWPGRALQPFLIKLTLNQIILGPIIISTLFAWNFWLQGKGGEIWGKLQADFVKTLLGGWVFWVPAAAVNFTLIPVHFRVLYMSACGMLWAGFLSYVSEKKSKKEA